MTSLRPLHFIQARQTLGMSQGELGEKLGVVKRTIQRWESHGAIISVATLEILAAAVLPRDREMAARIAVAGGTSLLALGLEKPPPPPAPPPPPPPPPPLPPLPTSALVDSILCVAADAVGMLPRAIRPALAAAFARAREVRLDVGAVADSLAGARTESEGSATKDGG